MSFQKKGDFYKLTSSGNIKIIAEKKPRSPSDYLGEDRDLK